MHDDVFDYDDGVVDDQADGGSEAAEGHQVEALSDGPEKENRNRYGYRNDEAGDQRAGPVAQEEDEDHAARISPMKMASRTLAMDRAPVRTGRRRG